jgi:chemotaxis family two-component system sensor kinase Cph1
MQEKKAVVCVGELPAVYANSVHLHHVFLNLLSNAIKFQSTAAPHIEINARESNGYVEVSVRDNGIGIEPKYAQQIFQVFQRLHPKSKYEGNGIGLAICKKIVEQHKGKIWVESKFGEGATFRFTLPVSKHHNWDVSASKRKVEANAGLN